MLSVKAATDTSKKDPFRYSILPRTLSNYESSVPRLKKLLSPLRLMEHMTSICKTILIEIEPYSHIARKAEGREPEQFPVISLNSFRVNMLLEDLRGASLVGSYIGHWHHLPARDASISCQEREGGKGPCITWVSSLSGEQHQS